MPHRGLERQVDTSAREGLSAAQQGLSEAPSQQELVQLFRQLFQQTGGLQQERQRLSEISPASLQVQQLARQAAFAPVEGLRTFLDDALTQAAQPAQSRGVGRSSISAALQARAVPQIMGPALAQAQGLESQLLLDIPFRERQFGLQSVGLGGQLNQLQGGFGEALGGLRESAFVNLQRQSAFANQIAQQRRQQHGGFFRALAGVAGLAAGSFLGPIGGAIGQRVAGAIGNVPSMPSNVPLPSGFDFGSAAQSPFSLPSMQISATQGLPRPNFNPAQFGTP
jgi:hypothetical protein